MSGKVTYLRYPKSFEKNLFIYQTKDTHLGIQRNTDSVGRRVDADEAKSSPPFSTEREREEE